MKPTNNKSPRERIRGALRYWETKRLLFNLVLAAFTLVLSFREFVEVAQEPAIQVVGLILVLGFFCLVANLCYSAVYVADFILQLTPFSQSWPRYRWVLFTAGTSFACMCIIAVLYVPHPM